MSTLLKILVTIRAAAGEQRGYADQCIHAPKAKAQFLAAAADLDAAYEAVEALGADKARLDYLEKLIRHCPHAEFYFSDDEDNEKPMGFSIEVDGCDPSSVSAPTLREAIDKDIVAHRS